MTTTKQAAANRLNARKSTGPRSAAGRAAVSANALKRKLPSLLSCESSADYERLARSLRVQFAPVGELEAWLVKRLAGLLWRLRRIEPMEAGLYEGRLSESAEEHAKSEAKRHETHPDDQFAAPDLRGRLVITDPTAHAVAMERVNEARAFQESPGVTLGGAWRDDAAVFLSLSKYAKELWMQFENALSILTALQSTRKKTTTAAANGFVSAGNAGDGKQSDETE